MRKETKPVYLAEAGECVTWSECLAVAALPGESNDDIVSSWARLCSRKSLTNNRPSLLEGGGTARSQNMRRSIFLVAIFLACLCTGVVPGNAQVNDTKADSIVGQCGMNSESGR